MPAEDVDLAAIDDGFFHYMAFTQGLDGAAIRRHYERGRPERILDFTVRTGPFGDRYGERPEGVTLDKLMAQHTVIVGRAHRGAGAGDGRDHARGGVDAAQLGAR